MDAPARTAAVNFLLQSGATFNAHAIKLAVVDRQLPDAVLLQMVARTDSADLLNKFLWHAAAKDRVRAALHDYRSESAFFSSQRLTYF